MTIERDLRRMVYTVNISREEMYIAFQSLTEFDKLIGKIAKAMWGEKVKYYEDISRKRLS